MVRKKTVALSWCLIIISVIYIFSILSYHEPMMNVAIDICEVEAQGSFDVITLYIEWDETNIFRTVTKREQVVTFLSEEANTLKRFDDPVRDAIIWELEIYCTVDNNEVITTSLLSSSDMKTMTIHATGVNLTIARDARYYVLRPLSGIVAVLTAGFCAIAIVITVALPNFTENGITGGNSHRIEAWW